MDSDEEAVYKTVIANIIIRLTSMFDLAFLGSPSHFGITLYNFTFALIVNEPSGYPAGYLEFIAYRFVDLNSPSFLMRSFLWCLCSGAEGQLLGVCALIYAENNLPT